MAKVRNNVLVRGLSGSFGEQMVIKVDKAGRTIVSNKPEFDENRAFTPAQQTQQERFREAAMYAKDAKDLPVYAVKAQGTPMHPYNAAMADWLRPPEIREIDLSAWTGQPGQTIRIRAVDDVQVTEVTVAITDETEAVLEQGAAVDGEGSWWTYTTTASLNGSAVTAKVLASAKDLPGHSTEMMKSLG
ncbi:MAG: hypothetical protein JW730_15430 [Anaerolineales bacterium]|nr:hypothetical protein [Anaerolineales bacterium]